MASALRTLMVVAALSLALCASARADVVAVDSFSATGTGTSVEIPGVTVAAGSDRLLAVGISTTEAATVTGVSFGAQPLTSRVSHAEFGTRAELWTLTAPSVGTETVTVTLSSAVPAIAGAVTFTGVDQIDPVIVAVGGAANQGSNSASLVLNGTVEEDGMIGVLALGNVANTSNLGTEASIDTVTADVRWNATAGVHGAGATRVGNTGQNEAQNAGIHWRWNRLDPMQLNPYSQVILALRAAASVPPNQAPTANAGGPYSVSEGSSLSLSAAGSSDPEGDTLTYTWDVNGDGVFGDATGVSPMLTWAQLTALGLGDGPAASSVRVRVTDLTNPSVTSSPATLTITNTAPDATLGNDGPIFEGEPGNVTFTGASDPSAADTAAGFRYAFDFDDDGTYEIGDGTYAGGVSSPSAALPAALAADGPSSRTVRGAIIDRDGGLRTHTTIVTVLNVAPSATFGNDGPVVEGDEVTFAFTGASDPSAADTAAGFRYAFDFDDDGTYEIGDGTYAGGTTEPSTTFEAEDDGDYTVRAAIIDRDGGLREYTTTAVATNAPPTVTITGPASTPLNESLEFKLQANDPSSVDGDSDFEYEIDWGDGQSETVTGLASTTAAHTYAAPGDYVISVAATDKDGDSSTPSTLAVTIPAPPVAPPADATTADTSAPPGIARVRGLSVRPYCVPRSKLASRTVTIRYRLNLAAEVRISLQRRTDSPVWHRCPRPGDLKLGQRRSKPIAYAPVHSRQVTTRPGGNSLLLTGGLDRPAASARAGSVALLPKGRKLRPGTYRLSFTALSPDGRPLATVRVKFWVVPG